ncbi:MAG: antibiotic biosynthesis monooxygenase [Acidimicrobiaceae bacterium]|jgi:heme-degrading monooxygenase HmoA|nr:antibiotic biosynthesis monooxygenase [Acidimicrobiaceae bacterium]
MVTEHALIPIRPGAEAEFEAAFPAALQVVSAADGCSSVRLLRGVEQPSTYLLLIEWESLEAHMEGFRGSAAFAEWRAIIGPFFDGQPAVDHFQARSNSKA